MFDKNLFDRNAFDRSVSSDGITLAFLGAGQIGFRFTIKTPIGGNLSGGGSLVPNIQMQQRVAKALSGAGDINKVSLILKRSTAAPLTGQGALGTNFVIRTPIASALSGQGNATINSQMFLYQNIRGGLSGSGIIDPRPVLKNSIMGNMQGGGSMPSQIALWLPLTISLQGQGAFLLRRLGALNENVIELIDINFMPGETITIDTDLLQVLFGPIEDVSSITNNSVFFELNPGENEITIDVDSDSTMDVVAIWQNRWL